MAESSGELQIATTDFLKRESAALYLRVSDKRLTIENQFRVAYAQAVRDGYRVPFIRIYADVEKGDSPLDVRTGFMQLLRDARARQFKRLYVFTLDRLTRSGPLWALLLDHVFTSIGIEWVSVKEPHLATVDPSDRQLFLALEGWRAMKEKQRISERNRAAVATARARGHRIGRPPGKSGNRPRRRPRQRGTAEDTIRALLGPNI